jgi:biopolymer transport protein ExbD
VSLARRTFFGREPSAEADVRPTLLGVVTLMFLLLFFLLTTSSGQRLGVLELRLGSAADLAPLPHTGLLKQVRVGIAGTSLVVVGEVQSTDISSSATTVEKRTTEIPAKEGKLDLGRLRQTLQDLHDIDPSQERARIDPDDTTTTETIIAVMDVVHGPTDTPLFPKLMLAGSEG